MAISKVNLTILLVVQSSITDGAYLGGFGMPLGVTIAYFAEIMTIIVITE